MSFTSASPEQLRELAAQAHAVATGKGWDVPTLDNLLGKLMLVEVELHLEAQIAANTTKKHSTDSELAAELADVGLRLLAILHAIWPDWCPRPAPHRMKPELFVPFETLARPVSHWLCQAAQSWRKGEDTDVRICLELAFDALWELACKLDIDLITVMDRKLEINRTREPLHGKVRTLG